MVIAKGKAGLCLTVAAFLICLTAPITTATANVIDVSYTVSGTPGDYVYDFSFTNNIGTGNDIYFLGVSLPGTNIVVAPDPFTDVSISSGPWTYTPSGTNYNNLACINDCDGDGLGSEGILSGQMVSGFEFTDTTSLTPLWYINWFAYAAGGVDSADDGHFGDDDYPGFEGIAIPEAETWTMMLIGLGGLALARSRRHGSAAAPLQTGAG